MKNFGKTLFAGIAALGGNPAATADSGVAPGDAGLVRHAARYGTDPTIRQRLRVEDKEIRRNYGRRNIFRIGPRDICGCASASAPL